MLLYLLQCGLILTVLLALYHGFLHHQKQFAVNRIFLLLAPFISFLAPLYFVYVSPIQLAEPLYTGYLGEIVVLLADPVVIEPGSAEKSIQFNIAYVAYFAICFIFLSRFLFGLYRIFQIKRNSSIAELYGHRVYLSDETSQIFSFWSSIFLPAMHSFRSEELKLIVQHEAAHIRLWHSADRVLSQCLKVLLWFLPPIYWLDHLLKETHEFQADAAVLKSDISLTKPYGLLLIQQQTKRISPVSLPVHPFISTLKNRITMMTQNANPNRSLARYALLVPIMAISVIAISMMSPNQTHFQQLESHIETTIGDTTVLSVADQMPRFKGCEDIENMEERTNCSNMKMLEFIYQNIRYPQEAVKDEIGGTVVVRFIIERDGSVSNIEVVRSVSNEIDKESERVVKLMQNEIMWKPGIHEGKPVRVSYNLPIRFRLTD